MKALLEFLFTFSAQWESIIDDVFKVPFLGGGYGDV